MSNERKSKTSIADAIVRSFESPNVIDSNFENANIVDVLGRLASATHCIAKSLYPIGAMPGEDRTGGRVSSLTEAVMGIAAGLCNIADSIDNLASAVREKNN